MLQKHIITKQEQRERGPCQYFEDFCMSGERVYWCKMDTFKYNRYWIEFNPKPKVRVRIYIKCW